MITTSFPFDYLKNCIIEVQCKLCGNYITIDKNNAGNNISQQILNCVSINREVRVTHRRQQFPEFIDYLAIISNIIDTNDNIYLKCNDITSIRSNPLKLGPTVYYTLNNIFTLSGYANYPFGPNAMNAFLTMGGNHLSHITLARTVIRGDTKIEFDYEFELITTTASGTTILLNPSEAYMEIIFLFYEINSYGGLREAQPFSYIHYPDSGYGHISLNLTNLIDTSSAYDNFYGEIHIMHVYISSFNVFTFDKYPARTDGYITISNLRLYDCCNELIIPNEKKFSAHKNNTHSLAFNINILPIPNV